MGLTARVKCSFEGYLIATWIQHHIGVMKAQRCGESWQILSNKEVFFFKANGYGRFKSIWLLAAFFVGLPL